MRIGGPKSFFLNDSILQIDVPKEAKEFFFDMSMVISMFKVYNDEIDYVEFEMKIVCEKLDEIAKDVNVESGVEDSEPEEK